MKNLLITFFTILFCLTSSIGWSAYFQKGLVAYNNGEFVVAFNEFSFFVKLLHINVMKLKHHL